MLTLKLPIPPSTNALYRNAPGRGRVKTRRYKTWCLAAGWDLRAQAPEPFAGNVIVDIAVPRDNRRDCDNYAKGLLDLLTEHGVYADDRNVDAVTVRRVPANGQKTVTVTVKQA